jgi:hypothetical protein
MLSLRANINESQQIVHGYRNTPVNLWDIFIAQNNIYINVYAYLVI